MPDETSTEGLSIDQAFDKGLAELPETPDSGSPTPDSNGSPNDGANGAPPDPVSPDGDQNKTPDPATPAKPDEGASTDGSKPQPEGEYTKTRFDGLMSAWQKDKTRITELETAIAELKKNPATPAQPPAAASDVELPPELANADEETKNGYRVLMSGVQRQFGGLEQKILSKVMETINAPIKAENEAKTKVESEITELGVSEGNLFTENRKEVLEYAAKNQYPLGTLKQAFGAWKREQELTGRIKTLEKGKEINNEIDEEAKKKAALPKGSKPVASVVPHFDPERDGEKSMDEIWNEAAKNI